MFATKCTLATSLLPSDFFEAISKQQLADKQVLKIMQLLANAALGTTEAWLSGQLKRLDPNPGDGGCQKRGFLHLPSLWQIRSK